MKKRILSMLLAIVMVVGTIPGFAVVASAATITGQCGTSATYTLTDDGVLTVSGTGAIEARAFGSSAKTGATTNKGFTDYLKIRKVVINEGITDIGWSAFTECSSITSVTLPSTITRIQDTAFFQCKNLESINIPEGVTSIGTNAFYGCKKLTAITLPSTLTSMGNAAFQSCTSLKTVILSEGMTASIPQWAFANAILTDITIPASVPKLIQNAFWGASNLKNVTIKNNDITFGDQVFSASDIVFTVPCDFDKTKITAAVVNNQSFTFSSDYLHIDANNDGVCDAGECGTATVASVSLNTNSITLNAVGATETLTATVAPDTVSADLTWRSDNSAVATVSNGVVTAVGAGTATITVEAGGKTAKCTVTVDLPENPVTGVSMSQTSLTLAIGDSYELDAIIEPENADIKTVTWTSGAENVATVDSDGIVTGVAAGTATITVTTQNGGKTATCTVTVLENHEHTWDSYTGACGGCSLTHYTHGTYEWNNGNCSVCGVAGGYCGYVGTETSVEYILTSTDSGSTYTLTIYGYGAMGEYLDYSDSDNPPWYDLRTSITAVEIRNGVLDIGWGAFKNHTALQSVSIPSSVTEIKRAAFLGATSLTSISIPSSVTTIGQSVFKKSGLTSISIPSGVTKIQGATFSECTKLTSVTLHDNITEIEGSAFQQCTALTSINIPNSVTRIGVWAFNQSGLTSVTIPASVTSLGMHAFSGCPKLKTVTINGTNLTIAERAFQDDEALETLTINNTGNVSIGDYAFMINVTDDDGGDVIIGDVTIGGWESEDGGSIDTDSGSSGSNGTTGDNTPGDDTTGDGISGGDTTGDGISGGDTTGSVTITRREDKLYSITLPANVTYATNYATSFGNRVRSISIDETAEVVIDSSITLPPPVFTPDTAYDKTITWTSSNEGVATVDSNGKVTGVSAGEVTITATAKYQLNGVYKSDSCTVTVVSHDHNWTYTAENGTGTITAKCGNAATCPDAEQSITISATGKTYDGTPVTATLTGSIDDVATPTINYSGNTNAGTFTASITIGGVTANAKFTIKKATVTVIAEANTKTYGDNDPQLTYDVSGLIGDDKLTGNLSRDSGENVGSYDIKQGTLSAGDNYIIDYTGAKLTITKAKAPAIIWPTASGLTYGQKLSESTLTSTDSNGTFAWQDGNTVPTVTNNGYVVVYTPKDAVNYDYTGVELTKTITVAVSKKTVTITVDNKSVCVEKAQPALTYTVSGLIDGDALITNPTLTTNAVMTTAGDYAITASGADAGNNYTVTYQNGTLTVKKHTPGTAATHTAAQTCTVCGHELQAALGHNYSTEWKSDGTNHWYECSCGVKKDTTAHTFTETVKDEAKKSDADCLNPAVYYKSCSVCGLIGNDTFTSGEANGHSFTDYDSDNNATCTTNATETAKCDHCDVTDTRTVADSATGHSFTNYVSDENATCTADGTKTAKCDHCDVTDTVTDTGSAKGHSFTDYKSDNNATCTADGTKTAKCNGCEETDTQADTDSKLAHTFEKGECTACGAEDPEYTNLTWLWILIPVVIVLGGFALYWFVIRKKKEQS